MKARTVAGRGWKSLLCDPGSELRVGRRERRRCAKIINKWDEKKRRKKKRGLRTKASGDVIDTSSEEKARFQSRRVHAGRQASSVPR